MAEKVTILKKRRGSIKSSLTKFKNFLENYNPANGDIEVLKIRLEKAKTLLDEFEKVHEEIEVTENVDDEASRQLFEESYFEYVATAQSLLNQHCRNQASTSDINNSISQGTDIVSIPARFELNIKLPVITLPKFDGKFDEWISFEDTFKALVHNNSKVQPVQKFNYLKSCLSGSAAQVIHSLSSTDENYEIASNLLIERFSNKRIIIQTM